MSGREVNEFTAKLKAEWGLKGTIDREKLLPVEVFWRDHQPWLQERGYILRPRFQPNWTPSWKGTAKDWSRCEDGQSFMVRTLKLGLANMTEGDIANLYTRRDTSI